MKETPPYPATNEITFEFNINKLILCVRQKENKTLNKYLFIGIMRWRGERCLFDSTKERKKIVCVTSNASDYLT